MLQHQEILTIRTPGRGLHDITKAVGVVVRSSGVATGVCTLFVRHTSASLLVQENAAPSARRDLERFLARLAPDGDPFWSHVDEGPDDMPAHARAALTRTSETIPVSRGELLLGTWQGIWLCEHRLRGSSREVVVHLLGEG